MNLTNNLENNYSLYRCSNCHLIPFIGIKHINNKIFVEEYCKLKHYNLIEASDFLQNMKIINNNKSFNKCNLCNEIKKIDKLFYCFECSKLFCDNCNNSHYNLKHKNFIEYKNIDNYCPIHFNYFNSYCQICYKNFDEIDVFITQNNIKKKTELINSKLNEVFNLKEKFIEKKIIGIYETFKNKISIEKDLIKYFIYLLQNNKNFEILKNLSNILNCDDVKIPDKSIFKYENKKIIENLENYYFLKPSNIIKCFPLNNLFLNKNSVKFFNSKIKKLLLKKTIKNAQTFNTFSCQITVFKSVYNKYLLAYFSNQNNNNYIYIYDLITEQKIKTFCNLYKSYILCIRHYSDIVNDYIILCSRENKIIVINVETGLIVIKFINSFLKDPLIGNYFYGISSMLLMNEYKYVISFCRDDDDLKIWDSKSKFIRLLSKCSNKLYLDTYYDKYIKKYYIISSGINIAINFELETGFVYQKYKSKGKNKCFKIIEINKKISIIFAADEYLNIFDFHNGNLIKNIYCGNNKEILCCLCIWNEQYCLTGGLGQYIYLIDIKKEQVKKLIKITNYINSIEKINIPSLGEMIISHDNNGEIKIWDINK